MTRSPFPGSPFSGDDLRTGLNSRFKQLYNAASFPLVSVGGTANDVTATLSPALDGDGLLDGMSFTITWAEENTAGVTLAINGGAPVPVLGADGLVLAPGAIASGLRSLVTYFAGDFVMISPSLLIGGGGAARYSWKFTASGTWTKPEGLSDDTVVYVQAWGGGGGGRSGSSGSGGGGGAYSEIALRAGDLSGTVTVTVGDGGAVGANGGESSFGSFLTAFGGQRGVNDNTGGRGGGSNESGEAGGYFGGGRGGSNDSGTLRPGGDASGIWGGGGGGVRSDRINGNASPGGRAILGGGGGGSRGNSQGSAPGGQSMFAGSGGNPQSAGQAPAGGGGGSASGARGEVRIWI